MQSTEKRSIESLLKEYLNGTQVLIADSAPASCTVLTRFLVKMGCAPEQVIVAGTFQEAKEELLKNKTKLVFSEFSFGDEYGIDLLQDYKQMQGASAQSNLIFVMVSADSAQYKIAMSVEESVDSYVIKPYAFDTIRNTIEHALSMKLVPTLYQDLIRKGKDLLFQGKIDDAISMFSAAIKEETEPTLACFYYGQAECLRSSFKLAEEKFGQALTHTPYHLEGLLGLYEILMRQKKYGEAYDTLKSLIEYFPANEERLQKILELTIITENFQDLEGYFNIYQKLNASSSILNKHMCSAICVAGKYYLRQKIKNRAMELFEIAIQTSHEPTFCILYAIESLVNAKLKTEAYFFMEELETQGKPSDAKLGEFYISSLETGRDEVTSSITLAQEIIASGNESPGLYEKIIYQLLKVSRNEEAHHYSELAKKKWPQSKNRFLVQKDA